MSPRSHHLKRPAPFSIPRTCCNNLQEGGISGTFNDRIRKECVTNRDDQYWRSKYSTRRRARVVKSTTSAAMLPCCLGSVQKGEPTTNAHRPRQRMNFVRQTSSRRPSNPLKRQDPHPPSRAFTRTSVITVLRTQVYICFSGSSRWFTPLPGIRTSVHQGAFLKL